MKADVIITESELKQIIKEHLNKKFKKVNEINIKVGTTSECIDPYRNDYQTYGVFHSVKCTVEI